MTRAIITIIRCAVCLLHDSPGELAVTSTGNAFSTAFASVSYSLSHTRDEIDWLFGGFRTPNSIVTARSTGTTLRTPFALCVCPSGYERKSNDFAHTTALVGWPISTRFYRPS